MLQVPIRNVWFWVLVCTSGILAAFLVRDRAKLTAYEAMIPYEIDIVAVDAVTDRPLHSISITDQFPAFVRFPVVRSYPDEGRMRFSGLGVFPVSVNVASEGYESVVVQIRDPQPIEPLRVKLKKTGEPGATDNPDGA